MPHVAATYGLNSIVDRIILELEKKVKQWRGVENESASLQEDLNLLVAQMDNYLKGWRREPRNPVARVNFEVMRNLVHDMEDCIEGFLSEIKLEKKKKEEGLVGVIPDVLHWRKKMGARDKFSKMIREIKKRAEEASNRRRGDPAAVDPALAPVGHRRDPVAEDPVGIAMAREDLCALLQDEVYGQPKQLRVISIVGFGGSGKTTLVRAVYRSLTDGATRRFPLHAWVDRADYNNPAGLLRCIIQNFWGDVTQSSNERELKDYISKHLERQQRYLIVLDDMEDTDPDFWGWIQSAFIDKGTSSRIVVTTGRMSMGQRYSSYGNGFVYKMRTIGNRGCKDLAFPGHQAPDDPASPEQMLLKICDGLPLALVSVANDFRGIAYGTIRNRCETLCRDFGSFLLEEATEMNQMAFANLRGVLMDHYVGLPGNTTRPCLLYLGIFSDGSQLKKNKITRRWVAEGYAETSDPQRREKVASDIFQELIDRNFIQPNGISSSHTYRALGVVLEFVLHRSSSDKFMMHFNSSQQVPAALSNGSKKVIRHIFVENFNDTNCTTTLDDVDLKRVRSLTVSGSAGGYISKIKKSKLMRVLDLEKCTDVDASHLKDIICKLRNLRYVSLGSNIKKLPEEITQLDLLESLHLSKREVIELPVEVIAMPCLIVLIGKFKLPYKDGDKDINDKHRHAIELSKNSKLQTLAGFVADGQKGFLLLMPYMKNLKKVKIWCNSGGNIGNLQTQLLQAIQKYTTHQRMNRSLCIGFEGLTPDDLAGLQDRGTNSIFQATANINYLSSLKLHGNLPVMPEFVTTLQDLAEVCLSLTTVTNDLLSTIGGLRDLVRLKLVAVRMVAVADVVTIREGFQSLKSLCLVIDGNDQVPQIHVQAGALPELVSLQLLYIMGPAGFSGIWYLTKLREIELHPGIGGPERRELEKAAQNHPNRPNILPFLSVDDHDVQVQPRPLIAQRIYGILDSVVQRLHPRNFYI